MTERSSKSAGVGFFAGLLVVIPVSLWVGMHIPQAVVGLAGRVDTVLTNWGILDAPEVRSWKLAESTQLGASTGWENPPWKTAVSPTRGIPADQTLGRPTQSSETPIVSHPQIDPSSRAEAGKQAEPGLFGWAGTLLRQATASATAISQSSQEHSAAGLPSGDRSSPGEGGAIRPAAWISERGQAQGRLVGVVPAHGAGTVASSPDAFSAVGWEGHWSGPRSESAQGDAGQGVVPASWRAETPPRGAAETRGGATLQGGENSGVKSAEQSAAESAATRSPESFAGGFSPADPRVQKLESRLRALGCTRYILEQFDGSTTMFHFVAELPEASGQPQVFEAIGADPFRVIEEVIAKIEASQSVPPQSQLGSRPPGDEQLSR
ncbi:MAG: hypothetical protein NZ899_10530 [Thermoguttaceae bacterium]|nr:hypothetical protein [Thermoguttaceae bacterium]